MRLLACGYEPYCETDIWMFYSGLVISILLSLIHSIKFFGIVSGIVEIVIVITLILISTYTYQLIDHRDIKTMTFDYQPSDLKSIFSAFSLCVFTFEGVFLVFPIRSTFLYHKKKIDFFKAFFLTTFVIGIFYIIFGYINFLGL